MNHSNDGKKGDGDGKIIPCTISKYCRAWHTAQYVQYVQVCKMVLRMYGYVNYLNRFLPYTIHLNSKLVSWIYTSALCTRDGHSTSRIGPYSRYTFLPTCINILYIPIYKIRARLAYARRFPRFAIFGLLEHRYVCGERSQRRIESNLSTVHIFASQTKYLSQLYHFVYQ